jgi:glycosyltransferase involved in cell wall biosynthesis
MVLISFVIPTYNASASIARCIQHILDQRGEFDREVIIVNDGSTDNTAAIVAAFPVNLFNRGASVTRNFGIAQAKGDFIVLIDADSFLDLNWTRQCLLEDPTTYDILLTNDLKYHEDNPNCRAIYEKIEKNPYMGHENMIGFVGNGTFFPAKNRDLLRYDEMYIVGGEDIDILLRLIDAGVRVKMSNRPSFLHKHMHRSNSVRYLSFIKKKIVFGYGNWRTFFKHPNSEYARRDALSNWYFLPVYPFIWVYKKALLIF